MPFKPRRERRTSGRVSSGPWPTKRPHRNSVCLSAKVSKTRRKEWFGRHRCEKLVLRIPREGIRAF